MSAERPDTYDTDLVDARVALKLERERERIVRWIDWMGTAPISMNRDERGDPPDKLPLINGCDCADLALALVDDVQAARTENRDLRERLKKADRAASVFFCALVLSAALFVVLEILR